MVKAALPGSRKILCREPNDGIRRLRTFGLRPIFETNVTRSVQNSSLRYQISFAPLISFTTLDVSLCRAHQHKATVYLQKTPCLG